MLEKSIDWSDTKQAIAAKDRRLYRQIQREEAAFDKSETLTNIELHTKPFATLLVENAQKGGKFPYPNSQTTIDLEFLIGPEILRNYNNGKLGMSPEEMIVGVSLELYAIGYHQDRKRYLAQQFNQIIEQL